MTQDACLVLIHGGELGRKYPIPNFSPIIIGRGMRADIRIDEEAISREHCEIMSHGGNVHLRDLDSTNGTFINDERAHQAVLKDGDIIKVGGCMLKFLASSNVENKYHEEIWRIMNADALTDTFNGRFFAKVLARELERVDRSDRELSMILLDIDHFKTINDIHGRVSGDEVLKYLARTIKLVLHPDHPEHVLARVDGEQFAILLPACGHRAAMKLGRAVRDRVASASFAVDRARIPVTVSVGVASVGAVPNTPQELYKLAEDLMYKAKRRGRDRVCGGVTRPRKQQQVDPQRTDPGARLIPELWLKGHLVEQLRAAATGGVAVVACALKDRLALLAELGASTLRVCEALLLESIQSQIGPEPSVSRTPDHVYLYLVRGSDRQALDALIQHVQHELSERLALVSLSPELVSICHGVAVTTDSNVSIDGLMAAAIADIQTESSSFLAKLPHPIARAASSASAVDTRLEELLAIFAGAKTIYEVLRRLFLAAALDPTIADDERGDLGVLSALVHAEDNVGALADVAHAARERRWPVLGDIAEQLRDAEVFEPLAALLALRARSLGQIHTQEAAESAVSDARNRMQGILAGLVCLGQYRMVTIAGMKYTDDGDYLCSYRDHTGPSPLFSTGSIKRKDPLRDGTYLLDRGSNAPLALSPLIVMRSCNTCGQSEMFWIRQIPVLHPEAKYQGMFTGHLAEQIARPRLPALLQAPSFDARTRDVYRTDRQPIVQPADTDPEHVTGGEERIAWPTPHGDAREKLEGLLGSLFDIGALRRFVAFGPDGEAITVEMPGATASLADQVHAAVTAWRQRGLITGALFDRLAQERPHRADEIDEVRWRWLRDPE